VLAGGSGIDFLVGGDGRDELLGGAGDDTLDGGDDSDQLDGGEGDDVIDGGVDHTGFFGDDLVSYASSAQPVTVDLNLQGKQEVTAGEHDRIVRVEDVEGSRLNDHLIGDHNANLLLGRDGKDILEGNNGTDTLAGGDGADVLFPSPRAFLGVLADGKADIMDCGDSFEVGDGDPGDVAFRVLADGDFVKDCASVFDI
jgi:Ca2+-binding RTX toxin-like protein